MRRPHFVALRILQQEGFSRQEAVGSLNISTSIEQIRKIWPGVSIFPCHGLLLLVLSDVQHQ